MRALHGKHLPQMLFSLQPQITLVKVLKRSQLRLLCDACLPSFLISKSVPPFLALIFIRQEPFLPSPWRARVVCYCDYAKKRRRSPLFLFLSPPLRKVVLTITLKTNPKATYARIVSHFLNNVVFVASPFLFLPEGRVKRGKTSLGWEGGKPNILWKWGIKGDRVLMLTNRISYDKVNAICDVKSNCLSQFILCELHLYRRTRCAWEGQFLKI